MEIVDVVQGSPEWFELRKRRMTASHASAIAACGKGLETYINDKMEAIYMTEEVAGYKNAAMERGNELEPSAALLYSFEVDEPVETVGFVIHSDHVGCSPDRLVGDDGLVEIKCPENKKFFKMMQGEKVDTGYVWQMQCQMLICEREWCDFFAYNPNPKSGDLFIVQRFHADEKAFAKLEKGFEIGLEIMQSIEKQLGKL